MLRNRMMQDLRLAGYALKTQKTYLECIGLFAQFCWEPAQADQEGVGSALEANCGIQPSTPLTYHGFWMPYWSV